MLRRLAPILLFGFVMLAACEKSDSAVLQEQFEQAPKGCPNGCAEPSANCTIKGNVSGQGLKFYILPGDPRYDLAIVEPARGEFWFCTAQEAADNGFQPVPPGA